MTLATDEGTITHQHLLELLEYNPETGHFTCKVSRADAVVGAIAGYLHISSGYWLITINWRKYKAHRLAWFYMTGQWPILIDHIDGDKSNNKFSNFREVDTSRNQMNSKLRTDNTSGRKGVYFDVNNFKWRAYIDIYGKRKYLGRYVDIDSAIAARDKAETELFGEFAFKERP